MRGNERWGMTHSKGFCSLWLAPSPFPPGHSSLATFFEKEKTKCPALGKIYPCQKATNLFSSAKEKSVKPIQQHCFPWPETFCVVYLFCKLRCDHNAGKIEITSALNTSRWGEGLLSNAIIQIIHLDMDYMIIADVNWVSDLAWEKNPQ